MSKRLRSRLVLHRLGVMLSMCKHHILRAMEGLNRGVLHLAKVHVLHVEFRERLYV